MECSPSLALGSELLASLFLGIANHPDAKPAPWLRDR
jgi:hypothetical protein